MNDFFLSCKESRIDGPRNFYGSFYLGPFSGSQSLTVANALRRTLLSELKGIAITSISIEGAKHEFSTLPGIRESVLDIVLNVKEIVLKSSSSFENTQIGYLQAYGPGVVRASDLKLPTSIQCVDPDQYIATLSQDGVLVMKFTINEGNNYVVQKPLGQSRSLEEGRLQSNLGEGTRSKSEEERPLLYKGNDTPMFLDAVFMPVNKVNYLIESYPHSPGMSLFGKNALINQNANVTKWNLLQTEQPLTKKETNYYLESNKELQVIILEIWTNGSIHPRKALYQGLNHLMNLFSQLEKMKILHSLFTKATITSNKNYETMFQKVEYEYDYYTQLEQAWHKSTTQKELSPEAILAYKKQYRKELLTKSDLKSIPVASLNISNRSRKLLERAEILNLADLMTYSPKSLKQIQGFGEKCLEEVKLAIEEIGLELKTH